MKIYTKIFIGGIFTTEKKVHLHSVKRLIGEGVSRQPGFTIMGSKLEKINTLPPNVHLSSIKSGRSGSLR